MKVKGFTLIEISIVLVIIGLIIGGVLVGRDLISAAGIRAQISQIEKYQTAVNTFRVKYGYLPGDIPDPYASQFGFIARGQYAGEGDGNGLIEGIMQDSSGVDAGYYEAGGEDPVFWVDLSTAKLINGNFNTATQTVAIGFSGSTIDLYFPKAKIGRGNYVYVYSGGWQLGGGFGPVGDNKNYFGLSVTTSVAGGDAGMYSDPGLTVLEAYTIDKKIDDGLPQSGRVLTIYEAAETNSWTAPGTFTWSGNGPYTTATPWASTNCYDNNGVAGVQQYSLENNGGSNNANQINCALSFQFQ